MISTLALALIAVFISGFFIIVSMSIQRLNRKVFNLDWKVRKCSVKIERLEAEYGRLKAKNDRGGNPF